MAEETKNLVVASFKCPAMAKGAIKWAREEELDFDYFSPFPEHHLEDEYFEGKKRSPVRRVTLAGATTGCLGAFLFTSWMSIDYPIRVSAKPLLSYPAFVVNAFECTILLGALATMGALLHFCRLPHIFRTPGYRPHFSEGHFGVVIKSEPEKVNSLKSEMENLGANTVELEYTR